MESRESARRESWLVEVARKLRHRPDLIIALAILGGGTVLLCWIGMPGVDWYWRVPVAAIAVLVLVGMTLGMIHDYTDPDERDSREWLQQQHRRHDERD